MPERGERCRTYNRPMPADLPPILDTAELRARRILARRPTADGARRDGGGRSRTASGGDARRRRSSSSRGPETTVAMRSWPRAGCAGWYHDVLVVFPGDASAPSPDAAAAHQAFIAAGGSTVDRARGSPPRAHRRRPLRHRPQAAGRRRSTRPSSNGQTAPARRYSRSTFPPGLDAETGNARAPTIRAAATATFIALKPGLLTADGPDFCGELSVHALGIDATPAALGPPARLACARVRAAAGPRRWRARNVNKGTFGTLGILGGTEGMGGALILAGRAALRTGRGQSLAGLPDGGRAEVRCQHA